MAISRKRALAQGEKAIERPKGQMEVTLYHGVTGLTLRYQGQVIARTHASAIGKKLAPYVAQALGAPLPEVGGATKVMVSSGVMFRVLSISSLDLRNEAANTLLLYLLQEADEMRGFKSAVID